MAARTKKKSGSPPKARGKMGDLRKTTAKLKKVNEYLAAQPNSPAGSQVATQATALKAALSTYTGAAATYVTAKAAADKAESDEVAADAALDTSVKNYVNAGNEVAAGDADVLKSLAIDAAALRSAAPAGPPPAPATLTIAEGEVSGETKLKWGPRPLGVAAFVVQYKLEALPPGSPAGTPAPDWSPVGGYHTKKLEWVVDGLPPAAAIRGRVQSIGDELGPWSDDVLGKAR